MLFPGIPLLLFFASLVRAKYESRLESIKRIDGDTETLFEFNLRVIGRDNLANGSMNFLADLSDEFEVSTLLYVLQRGEWRSSNIGVCYKSCTYIAIIYATYFAPSFKDSNFPIDKESCPIKKGEYYVRNADLSGATWANFGKTGLNKCIITIRKDDVVFGGLEVVVVLTEQRF
ncbi:uncharacterized protein LOC108090681 isoform X2 [Drosophila ficusphila]|uniref:uncharacterized protein LOC108090681 isoform X2 n=1 Tax=Drosophila ficusphila TaxID=30025 RepID=UPI0007E6AD37|nr:uncharacterized protein LOC108090681 isoform X2 [Drosophila ficusphila]